MEEELRHFVI